MCPLEQHGVDVECGIFWSHFGPRIMDYDYHTAFPPFLLFSVDSGRVFRVHVSVFSFPVDQSRPLSFVMHVHHYDPHAPR